VTVDEFRAQGFLPEALVNYLALLGWSYDDRTTIMSREELVDRFSLERVSKSPAIFDYDKLTWMNGVYLRSLPEDAYAAALVGWLRDEGYVWDAELVRKAAPLAQEKIALLSEFPGYAGFLFSPVEPEPSDLEGQAAVLESAAEELAGLEPFTAAAIEAALRALADTHALKPREAFQPIRVAVTGSRVSPGLFESIELLGRDESVARLRAAAAVVGV
jgi:glutamyl-tRNA synthetase